MPSVVITLQYSLCYIRKCDDVEFGEEKEALMEDGAIFISVQSIPLRYTLNLLILYKIKYSKQDAFFNIMRHRNSFF